MFEELITLENLINSLNISQNLKNQILHQINNILDLALFGKSTIKFEEKK